MILKVPACLVLACGVVWGTATSACTAPPATTATPGKEPGRRALLIGINKYKFSGAVHDDPKEDFLDLDGAAGDPVWLASILTSKYAFKEDDICILTDLDATHAGIVSAFRNLLIGGSADGDVALFYFAGHGSYTEDEQNQFKDTTLIPADGRDPHPMAGREVFDISTAELHSLFLDLLKKTANVTSILDSCYSSQTVRGGPGRAIAPARNRPSNVPVSRGGPIDLNPVSAVVRIAAAGRDQESHETDDHQHGLMSLLLFTELENATEQTTWNQVMDSVKSAVIKAHPDQTPGIQGNGDAKIFGGIGLAAKEPFLLVSPRRDPTTVTLNGGSLHGLANDAILDVYPPGTREFTGASVAKIRLTSTDDTVSEASVIAGALERSKTGYRAILRSLPPTAFRFRIWFEGTSPQIAALRISAITSVVGAEASDKGRADVGVRFRGDVFEIERVYGEAPNPSQTASNTAEALGKLKLLSDWYLKLRQAGAKPALDLTITRNGRQVSEVSDGQAVTFTLCNGGDQEYFVAVVDFQSTGASTMMDGLALSGDSKLRPGQCATTEDIVLTLDEGQNPSGVQIFKAIATLNKADLAYFNQSPETTNRGEPPNSARWSAISVPLNIVKH